jgi:hypothetical protein
MKPLSIPTLGIIPLLTLTLILTFAPHFTLATSPDETIIPDSSADITSTMTGAPDDAPITLTLTGSQAWTTTIRWG